MPIAGPLPQTGDQQEIGADAARCFGARAPRNWRVHPLDGTDDFGFDYQVQTTPGQQATDVFRVQLKGTRSPDWSANREFISMQLKASTVRYYERVVEPILLVVCDLTVDPDPVDCHLYYVWLRDELGRISVSGLDPQQKYVTLRVPVANRLKSGTNLGPEIDAQNELARAGHLLGLNLEQALPELTAVDRTDVIHGIAARIADRSSAFVGALAAPPDQHWIDPERGSMGAHLRAAELHMKVNLLERTEAELECAFDMLPTATTLEAAEYWFWRGKWHVAHCRDAEAAECFRNAVEIKRLDKYIAALVEAELRTRPDGEGVTAFPELHALIEGNGPLLILARSRLFAAEGAFDDAHRVANELSGADRTFARALIHTMRSESDHALADCLEGLSASDISDGNREGLLVLRARAKFFIAQRTARESAGEILPPSGMAGIDSTLAKDAWIAIQDAVQVLRDAGWGRNVELIADIWGATASMLGKQAQVMPVMAEIAKLRPKYVKLQSSVEAIAAQCGDFELALAANEQLPPSPMRDLRRTISLHEAGRDSACVAWFESRFVDLDHEHILFGPATSAAALSAHRLAKPSLFKLWASALEAEPRLAEDAALLQFYVALDQNAPSKAEAVQRLIVRFEALGGPFSIAVALLQELDPTVEAQASLCLQFKDRVLRDIEPSPAMASHVGVALITLRRWGDLLTWCQQFRARVDAGPRMLAFEALALDQLGRTTDAKEALESMLDLGIADSLALQTYVAIAVRCGYVDEALSVAERIMEAAGTRSKKMECVRLRFNLIQQSDFHSERLLALALQMARLANPTIEEEEARYLQMFLVATMGDEPLADESDSEEFHRRAEAFFSAFPTSPLLKRGQIVEEQSGEDLLAQIRDLVGISPEREAFRRRLERNLKDGLINVPYSWRPKQILSSVHDCVHLWELGKHSSRDDKQLHLLMANETNWSLIGYDDLCARVPLLDITALLVLHDLDLFELFLDLVEKVAISKATMEELAQLVHVFAGSPARQSCSNLQEMLKSQLHRIDQPSVFVNAQHEASHCEEGDLNGYGRENAEIASLCRSGEKYRLYSDDVAFRVLVGRCDKPDGMCTLDVLSALVAKGLLTDRQAADKLALLCKWNVGVVIRLQDLLATIPAEFSNISTTREGLEFLQRQTSFVAIANAVWDIRVRFDSALSHASSILRELADLRALSRTGIAAFQGHWFVKILLRNDCPYDPLALLAKLVVRAATPQGLTASSAGTLLWICGELFAHHTATEFDDTLLLEILNAIALECTALDSIRPRLGEMTHASLTSGLTHGSKHIAQFAKMYRVYSAYAQRGASP